MKDYEQKYYDVLFQMRKQQKQIEKLENEIEIYKSFLKSKNLKKTLIEFVNNYIKQKDEKSEE